MRTAALIAALALAPAAAADPIQVDSAPPVVAGLHLTATRQLSFSVSEYSLVHVTVRRDGRRVGAVQQAFLPGSGRIAIRRIHGELLRRGSYTATVTANDVAQNRTPAQVIRFRVTG